MPNRFFKYKSPNKTKLSAYGFTENGADMVCSRQIAEGKMRLEVTVSPNGDVKTRVTDVLSDEEYILHLVKSASGSFIGLVREEYESVLRDISKKCFDEEIFKAEQTKRVIGYFENKYGDKLEHLWADAPDNAIVRRKDNQKWYAAILTVPRKKLGQTSEEPVEIIDLHARTEDIEALVDYKKYFPGFHMNKKHWITVCLDDTVGDDELFQKINESYALGETKTKNKTLITTG